MRPFCSVPYRMEIKVLIFSLKMMSLFFYFFFFLPWHREKVHYKSALWLMALNRYGWIRWWGEPHIQAKGIELRRDKLTVQLAIGKMEGMRRKWMFGGKNCIYLSHNLKCSHGRVWLYCLGSFCFESWIRDHLRVHHSWARHLQLSYSAQIRTEVCISEFLLNNCFIYRFISHTSVIH